MSLLPSTWLADASHLRRVGLKGSGAQSLLEQAQIAVPAGRNTWAQNGSPWEITARLGSSEFFIEGDAAARCEASVTHRAYPVLREDRAFVLGGAQAEGVLAQVCNVDFASLDLTASPVILTLMTGVAVLVLPQAHERTRRYRIWCDPGFGAYLWQTLEEIVTEVGGKALELEKIIYRRAQ